MPSKVTKSSVVDVPAQSGDRHEPERERQRAQAEARRRLTRASPPRAFRPGPAGRAQNGGVSDRRAAGVTWVSRPNGLSQLREQVADVGRGLVGHVAAGHPPERIHPAPGLHERDAHEIAPALPGAAREGDEGAERGQVAGGVIHDLGGEMERAAEPAAESLLVGEAAHRLDQRLEAAPLAPRPRVAIGGERDVDDPGPEPRDLLGGEAEPGERAGTVGLGEDVGAARSARAAGRRPRPGGDRARRSACRARSRSRATAGSAGAAPTRAARPPRARRACARPRGPR